VTHGAFGGLSVNTLTGKASVRASRGAPRAAEVGSDEELVARTLAGDRDAFEQLVRRHQRPLVNHLYRLTRLRDGALDLAQEVFIKVYMSMGSFDPRYRFTTWLYRIASNCAIDYRRKRQPRTCPMATPTMDVSEPPAEQAFPGPGPDPLAVLRLRELHGRLEDAIETLPHHYRHLILLRHRHFLRYDEIARATGLPVGTVKNRIFRARELLKKSLADVLDAEA
jgi:RNA polymerase sigma-70 factor (ECF subfamily)